MTRDRYCCDGLCNERQGRGACPNVDQGTCKRHPRSMSEAFADIRAPATSGPYISKRERWFRRIEAAIMTICIAALAAMVLSSTAHAGGKRRQNPDNWSDADMHFGVHFVLGIAAADVWPDRYVGPWLLCQVPGAWHEFGPGQLRSNRDLLMNAAGCGLGVWAGNGFGIVPKAGGAEIVYSLRF